MIDVFQKIAVRIGALRFAVMGAGVLFLMVIGAIVFLFRAPQGDRYLLPAVVGLLWSFSAYAFIRTFRSVPGVAEEKDGLWDSVKRRMHRGWYWLLAALFMATSVVLVFLTSRLIAIWLGGGAP